MKIITTIVALVAFTLGAHAQIQSVILQDGAATNKSRVSVNGTMTTVLNQVLNTNSFTVGTATNLGSLLLGNKVGVTAQNVGVVIAGTGATANATNDVIYYFQKSLDGVNWEAWTNLTVAPTGTTRRTTNVIFSLGDWSYIRVSDITNTGTAATRAWNSNYLGFFWKQ